MLSFIKKVLVILGIKENNYIYKVLSFFYNFKYNIQQIFHIAIIKVNFVQHKKIFPDKHIKMLSPIRAATLKKEISFQIMKYTSSNSSDMFIFVEVGSLLGDGLTVVGKIIHEKLKKNYLIISIDPYKSFSKLEEKKYKDNKNIGKRELMTDLIIDEMYYYFINNISLTNFKNNFFHLRMTSDEAFILLKKFNIKIDFCYIDGCHYYEFIKNDYYNYSSLMKEKYNYKGRIIGDDYELTFDELIKSTGLTIEKLKSILEEHKNIDWLNLKNTKNIIEGFHPGITLFFKDIKEVKKFESGIWYKDD